MKSFQLIENIQACGIQKILFSSSASVYGESSDFAVTEDAPPNPQSPYARTKLMTEFLLEDIARLRKIRAISLRYFNPIGAEPQLRTGEYVEQPTHVLGSMFRAALGKIPQFNTTGTEYPTRDGSAMRDFIHVADLALASPRPGMSPESMPTAKRPNLFCIGIPNTQSKTLFAIISSGLRSEKRY